MYVLVYVVYVLVSVVFTNGVWSVTYNDGYLVVWTCFMRYVVHGNMGL